MVGDFGREWSLPLLPEGTPVFESLPFGAVVLDALAPPVANGLITIQDGSRKGVLVVRDGVLSEKVWVADGLRSDGHEAYALIRAAETATVSASRLSEDAMTLVGPLIRGKPCYSDLRLEWVAWPQLLQDLEERGETFIVELTTPAGRGVTVVEKGRHVATFTESHPMLGGSDLLDALAAAGVGTIRVLIDATGSALHAPVIRPAASSVDQSPSGDADQPIVREILVPGDDPNATLSAFFGPHYGASDALPVLCADRTVHEATMRVESVLPQLKSLVQNRLQRSSAPVEDLVDGAANDGQTVEWLADRVRTMIVRGFLQSTFDQLADDMLALRDRDPV